MMVAMLLLLYFTYNFEFESGFDPFGDAGDVKDRYFLCMAE